jgi:omega-amidase
MIFVSLSGPGRNPLQNLMFLSMSPTGRSGAVWHGEHCIENQCYVVGVNRIGQDGNAISYGGDSMIIDPLGEVLHEKSQEESIFTYGLQKEKLEEVRMKFPFWKDADHFFIEP